jgi:prophage regulatory protein
MLSGNPSFDHPTPTVLINRDEVLRRTGLKKSTMYVLIGKGKFPHQVQKTESTVGWDEAEVEAWIQGRAALRSGPAAIKVPISDESRRHPKSAISQAFPVPLRTIPRQSQTVKLGARQLTELTGRAFSSTITDNPQLFFDSSTGSLWMCIMKVDMPASIGVDQK